MVKTRLQLKSEAATGRPSIKNVVSTLYKKEGGIVAFYKGLGAGLMRQMVYTSLRLGMFYTVLDVAKDRWDHPLNAGEKAIASFGVGGVASFIATPFDLALIRFQADGTLPVNQRRNYRNCFQALSTIVRSEGFFALWKGALPTIVRAMFMNLGMLAPYEECKQRLKPYFGESYTTYISSSFVAGLLASFLGLPFDNMKTKIQKMKPGLNGKMPYSGLADCARKTFRQEGLLRFWVGFPIFYVRIGMHAMITLLAADGLKHIILGKQLSY